MLIEHTDDGLKEVSAKGYRRIPINNMDGARDVLNFPIAEEDWGYVTHLGISDSEHGPIAKLVDVHDCCRRYIKVGQSTTLDLEII